MTPLLLLLLSSSLAVVCYAQANQVSPVLRAEVERDILNALYQYTNGDEWTRNEGWNNPEVHYCEWQGVTCGSPDSTGRRLDDVQEARSIESLDLSENNLRGPVPISLLLLLPTIRSLRLNGNNVDYSQIAQQEFEVLGANLDNLRKDIHSNIQRLDVSHTSVGDLERLFRAGHGDTVIYTPRLQNLYASSSQIQTTFPDFLTDVTTLERVALDHNSFTGTLPNTIGNWNFLKYLSVADNQMRGTLPDTFNQMGRLRYLLLGNNRFTGSIPIGLTSTEYTPLLEQLDLSHQRPESIAPGPGIGLEGHVPSFSTQKWLRRIDLGFNSLTGTIPSDLLLATENEAKTMVDFMILSNNLITGSVPSSVLHRIPTDGLFLEDNRITSLTNCPPNEFGCSSLLCPPGTYEPRSGRQEEEERPCLNCPQNTLYWGKTVCRYDESIPRPPPTPNPTPPPVDVPTTPEPTVPPEPTFSPTVSPTVLPPVPSVNEQGILSELYSSTGGNDWTQRTGWEDPNISDSFCSWHGVVCVSEEVLSVKYLHLTNNNLLGNLPSSIYTLPNLITLDVSHNPDLTMSFEGIERARALEALDISNTIVLNVDNLDKAAGRLKELHLSDVGGFQGTLFPPELFGMTNLRQLTLDYNGATGTLPDQLGSLSKLVTLSIANNNLSGTLPESITDLSDLSILRVPSNHFSGPLPVHFQKMTTLTVLDLSNQWSNGFDDDFADVGLSGLTGTLPSFANFNQLRRLDLAVNSFRGTIPDNFLAGVESTDLFEFADLSENFLTGTVPGGIANLHGVYMQDNLITGINETVCAAQATGFGCDAVLCKPGFYNIDGRQASADKTCEACNKPGGAPFFGSTQCTTTLNVPTSAPIPKPTEGPVPDSPIRVALRALYTKCSGHSWAANNHWMDESVYECLWDGVRCSAEGEVIGLSLRSNNLDCTFPTQELFEGIPKLQSLVLDGNTVAFPFDGIENAHSLGTLDLTHTDIESLAGIEKAPSLQSIYLASNNLEGPFPPELLQVTTLRRIGAAFNSFSGPIPADLSNLSELEFLSLHDNQFTGSIPSQVSQLQKLFFLLLQSNKLEGTIPTELNTLTNLRFLELSDQAGNDGKGLSGPLLPFDNMKFLKRLTMRDNSFTGQIPDNFLSGTEAVTFESLDLSKNNLVGSLPTLLSKFPTDRYDFTDNQISGIAPDLCDENLGGAVEAFGCDAVLCPPGTYNKEGRQLLDSDLCADCPENSYFGRTTCGSDNGGVPPIQPPESPPKELSDFEILRMLFDATKGSVWHRKDHWKQTGISVCEWYGIRCSTDGTDQITQITLTANGLLGTVPAEVFQLPRLRSLIVDSNNCHVNMTGLKYSSTLEQLDVSSTAINSVEGVGGARVLREFHIKSNSMTGTFPDEIFDVHTLEQIVFDFNHFKGPLGHKIGNLKQLRLFSGEKNRMSGVLPNELKQLTDLVTLRLGRNSFGGNIPTVLESMTTLTFIDLSHQTEHGGPGLSGRVPTFEKLSKLQELRLNSNSFSGTVPYDFLKTVNAEVFQYVELSSNQLTGTVPASLARLKDVYLQDNKITGIAPELCADSRGPVFANFGCDALLCPPQTFSNHGRQESDSLVCKPCATAQYYGSITCPVEGEEKEPDGLSPLPAGSDERDILVRFYQTCSGEEWDESNNWLTPTSICFWQGIKCVSGMESVEAIELGANNILGTPPPELFLLPNLKSLALYSNPVTDFTFEGIGRAGRLKELLLDAIGLESLAGLENAPAVETLNLRFNNLAGPVPTEISKLGSLRSVSMAYNHLTSTIPAFLEEMTNLHSLLLSNNELTGNMRLNFPSSLRRLDLSENQLTGPIPDSFLTLVPFSAELEIDLSDNRFTSVPKDLIRFSSLSIYLKGNHITELNYHLCSKNTWNEGDVGRYGCDGLLCPAGEYAPNGRHTSVSACKQCHHHPSHHMGASTCSDSSNGSTRTTRFVLVLLSATLSGAIFFIW